MSRDAKVLDDVYRKEGENVPRRKMEKKGKKKKKERGKTVHRNDERSPRIIFHTHTIYIYVHTLCNIFAIYYLHTHTHPYTRTRTHIHIYIEMYTYICMYTYILIIIIINKRASLRRVRAEKSIRVDQKSQAQAGKPIFLLGATMRLDRKAQCHSRVRQFLTDATESICSVSRTGIATLKQIDPRRVSQTRKRLSQRAHFSERVTRDVTVNLPRRRRYRKTCNQSIACASLDRKLIDVGLKRTWRSERESRGDSRDGTAGRQKATKRTTSGSIVASI